MIAKNSSMTIFHLALLIPFFSQAKISPGAVQFAARQPATVSRLNEAPKPPEITNLCDMATEAKMKESLSSFNKIKKDCNCDVEKISNDKWVLVQDDEFNHGQVPDSKKWNLKEMADGGEAFYTSRTGKNGNIALGNCEGGTDGKCLVISAKHEDYGTGNDLKHYTSGYVQAKEKYLYGRYEFRAKIPYGRGTWPSIWFLGNDPLYHWPSAGEMDVMEGVGYQPCQNVSATHSCMHSWGNDNGNGIIR